MDCDGQTRYSSSELEAFATETPRPLPLAGEVMKQAANDRERATPMYTFVQPERGCVNLLLLLLLLQFGVRINGVCLVSS